LPTTNEIKPTASQPSKQQPASKQYSIRSVVARAAQNIAWASKKAFKRASGQTQRDNKQDSLERQRNKRQETEKRSAQLPRPYLLFSSHRNEPIRAEQNEPSRFETTMSDCGGLRQAQPTQQQPQTSPLSKIVREIGPDTLLWNASTKTRARASDVLQNKVVLLYFSAHWCGRKLIRSFVRCVKSQEGWTLSCSFIRRS